MIDTMYPLGSISLTNEYFSDLASMAVQNCFGVAGMSSSDTIDHLRGRILGKDSPTKGVRVTEDGSCIAIELHIQVAYGVNIRTSVQSISHRVRSEVEQATGLKVSRVNVFVDDVVSL